MFRKRKQDELVEALQTLTAEMHRQNDITVRMASIGSKEAVKALADVCSRQRPSGPARY